MAASVAAVMVGFGTELVKPFGPVHVYVEPVVDEAFNERSDPSQIGELLVTVGMVGVGFTVAIVVAAADIQPATVTVRLYVPDAAMVAFEMIGFCKALVNPFGPVHEYTALATAFVVSDKVLPLQIGPLLNAAGVAGGLGSDKVNGPAIFEVHPLSVTKIFEYVPEDKLEIVICPGARAITLFKTVGEPLFLT